MVSSDGKTIYICIFMLYGANTKRSLVKVLVICLVMGKCQSEWGVECGLCGYRQEES